MIQEQLYGLEPPVFLRGAVAQGEFFLQDNLVFGKGLVEAYWAQEKYAIFPRIIISDEVKSGKMTSVDVNEELPKDDDGYNYINVLERYLRIEYATSWEEIAESEQYGRIMGCVRQNLSIYADDRVRQKYIWIKKELGKIQRKVLAREGIALLAGGD